MQICACLKKNPSLPSRTYFNFATEITTNFGGGGRGGKGGRSRKETTISCVFKNSPHSYEPNYHGRVRKLDIIVKNKTASSSVSLARIFYQKMGNCFRKKGVNSAIF